ncbi:uncharacterized protein LOC143904576 [Temnothorax americanus]|uniref:uncharacterized protein LOC143904576 n=1 Tax=Temnothorax americanus TaxID=1964332 RepID=UPI004068C7CE
MYMCRRGTRVSSRGPEILGSETRRLSDATRDGPTPTRRGVGVFREYRSKCPLIAEWNRPEQSDFGRSPCRNEIFRLAYIFLIESRLRLCASDYAATVQRAKHHRFIDEATATPIRALQTSSAVSSDGDTDSSVATVFFCSVGNLAWFLDKEGYLAKSKSIAYISLLVSFIIVEVRDGERLLRACFGYLMATAKTCHGNKRYSVPNVASESVHP